MKFEEIINKIKKEEEKEEKHNEIHFRDRETGELYSIDQFVNMIVISSYDKFESLLFNLKSL